VGAAASTPLSASLPASPCPLPSSQAVGYGTDPSAGDYYKVKNSWGADWGMSGYILLGRGASFNPSGQCGIQMSPSVPLKN